MGRHVVCLLHIELSSGRISEEDKIQSDSSVLHLQLERVEWKRRVDGVSLVIYFSSPILGRVTATARGAIKWDP